eukprot:scaffold116010_cov22-Prasinocladus_malaysianus.AAC.1
MRVRCESISMLGVEQTPITARGREMYTFIMLLSSSLYEKRGTGCNVDQSSGFLEVVIITP